MATQVEQSTITICESTSRILRELGVPVHRIGYRQLCVAIPHYAQDESQSFTKELYPFVAKYFGIVSWCAVERTIRDVILYTWKHGDPEVWDIYFPKFQKSPSNKQFISILAEHLK